MAYWSSYHSRGEAGPRADCLDTSGSVTLSYTWTDVCNGALYDHDNIAPVMREGFELAEETRMGIDGHKYVETGGFFYRAGLEFSWISKTTGGQITAVLNHCGKSGLHKVNFYPHSDNTDIYFVCRITGEVTDANMHGRPVAQGHDARLKIEGLEPFAEIPWPISRALKFMARGSWGSYSTAEKANSQMADKTAWATYTTTEKEDTIGYLTDTSQPVEMD